MEKYNIHIIVIDPETEKVLWEQVSHNWNDAEHRFEIAKHYYQELNNTLPPIDDKYENLNPSDDIFNQKVEA
jgi:hypothetical protein